MDSSATIFRVINDDFLQGTFRHVPYVLEFPPLTGDGTRFLGFNNHLFNSFTYSPELARSQKEPRAAHRFWLLYHRRYSGRS